MIKKAAEMLATLEEMRPAKEHLIPKKKRLDEQLPLFESPIIEELRRMNTNQLTPIQALQILSDLQSRCMY